MTHLDRPVIATTASCVAAAGGGAVVGIAFATSRTYVDYPPTLSGAVSDSPTTAVAVGVVIALMAVTICRMPRTPAVASGVIAVVGLVGVLLTVDSTFVSAPSAMTATGFAGLALGGLVARTCGAAATPTNPGGGIPLIPICLITGVVAGTAAARTLRHPFVYILNGPPIDYAIDTRSVGIALATSAVVAMAVSLVATPERPVTSPAGFSWAPLLGCVAVTAAAVVIGWWFEVANPVRSWYWGWLLTPVVLGVGWLLRSRGGLILAMALAWATVMSPQTSWAPHVAWLALLVPLAAAGVILGRRAHCSVLLCVLVAVMATHLIVGGLLSRTFSTLILFVVPVVVIALLTRYTAEALPDMGISVVALTAVALWNLSPRSVFTSFVYSPGDAPSIEDVGPAFLPHSVALAAEYVIPAASTLFLCVALVVVDRRGQR